MRRERPTPATLCPLTVVGGFLGAGKTTLLNRLLADAQGRYAVLVNDFGAVNVDAGLIRDHDGQTLRLTNGCVCCSLADGFLDTLMRVLAEPEPFDHIVIEASGVGDPGAIAEIALVEPGLVLRGVVVLVDAERLPALAADPRMGDTIARQIRAADILVLNKRDLVDAIGLAASHATLAALAPDVPVVDTVAAALPEALFALGGEAPGSAGRGSSRLRAEAVTHEDTFQRLLYRRTGTFDRAGLGRALAGMPTPLLRLKGRVRLGDASGMHLLQMVGRRWSLSPLPEAAQGGIELVGIAAADTEAGPTLSDLLDAALLPPQIPHGDRLGCD